MAKPFYFENAMFREKVTKLQEECPSCNTFFLGSSLTFRHINPMLFDSLVNKSSKYPKNKTYNLGSSGVNFLEAMYLVEHSIKNNIIPKNSTLFVELRPHSLKDSLFTAKNTFYRQPEDLELVLSPYQNFFDKVNVIYSSNAQYFFKSIHGGILSTLNKNNVIKRLKRHGKRGFVPLNMHLKSKNKPTPLNVSQVLYGRKHMASLREKLKLVNNIAKSHQIRLIYLVPNLSLDNSTDWKVHLIHPLQKDSTLEIIDMAQPQLYPELFDPDLYYDDIHLHKDGANLYTQLVADAYLKLEH
tara:strand:- start:655 stop:1551 length:897 start_codon:yes stop_codon:yes gene_type:complete